MKTPSSSSPVPGSSAFQFSTRSARLKASAIREILKATAQPEVISFAGGLPAPELFPVEAVARAAQEVLAADGPAAMQYGVTEGYLPLREWVCAHLAATVGLRAQPSQVLITHGSQQGLDLLGRVLLDPGDIVLTDNPAYVGALQAFHACEAEIVGVAGDAHGMNPDALQHVLRHLPRRAKGLYLIPNFQNPTGISLLGERRQSIMRIAANAGVPVIEDDPYGELRYSGQPQPALVTLSGGRDWVYLGTSSKIMAPGFRVAWMVVPDEALFEKLVTAKQAADLHTSSFTQRLVWRYVRPPGALAAHVQRLREVYAQRRDAMLRALAENLPEGCAWTQPEGGLFLWVRLPGSCDAMELLSAAAVEKVAFVPGEPFWVGPPERNTLRLNFSNATEPRIAEGVQRLASVIKQFRPAQSPRNLSGMVADRQATAI